MFILYRIVVCGMLREITHNAFQCVSALVVVNEEVRKADRKINPLIEKERHSLRKHQPKCDSAPLDKERESRTWEITIHKEVGFKPHHKRNAHFLLLHLSSRHIVPPEFNQICK